MLTEVLLPVFVAILLGYVLARLTKINTDPLQKIILYLATPCLIFSSLAKTSLNFGEIGIVVLCSALILVLLYAAVYVFFLFSKTKRKLFWVSLIYGNTGYIGYPVVLLALGETAFAQAIVFDVFLAIFLFSVGIYTLSHKKDWKEMFRIPVLPAALLGMAIKFWHVPVPLGLIDTIGFVGSITIPLALVYLGIVLAKVKMKNVGIATATAIGKMALGFVIAFFATWVLGIHGDLQTVIMLLATMPCAVSTTVLADRYRTEPEIAATAVLISTLLSIGVIPLILYIF